VLRSEHGAKLSVGRWLGRDCRHVVPSVAVDSEHEVNRPSSLLVSACTICRVSGTVRSGIPNDTLPTVFR